MFQRKFNNSQQKENRCPNTNLFTSTTRHRHQYNPCFSQNNGYTEYMHNLPLETDNQPRVWKPSDNIQNGNQYLFQKVLSTPIYDCKKQKSSTIGSSVYSHDGQLNTVGNGRVTTNNLSQDYINYYF